MSSTAPSAADKRELVLTRFIATSPDKLFRAWTEPALIKQWFAPKPWLVSKAETDVRVGGSSLIVMRGPDGNEFPNRGVYLEVVENERIVATDAFTEAWIPSDKAFMTLTLTFEPEGNGTRYTARVLHWSETDREVHENMGFHRGWGQCTDQLEVLVATL